MSLANDHDQRTDDVAVKWFTALASPVRIAIIRAIVQAGAGGLAAEDVTEVTDTKATNRHHHLMVLLESGFVKRSRHSKTYIYVLDRAVIGWAVTYICTQFMSPDEGETDARLDVLFAVLSASRAGSRDKA